MCAALSPLFQQVNILLVPSLTDKKISEMILGKSFYLLVKKFNVSLYISLIKVTIFCLETSLVNNQFHEDRNFFCLLGKTVKDFETCKEGNQLCFQLEAEHGEQVLRSYLILQGLCTVVFN